MGRRLVVQVGAQLRNANLYRFLLVLCVRLAAAFNKRSGLAGAAVSYGRARFRGSVSGWTH